MRRDLFFLLRLGYAVFSLSRNDFLLEVCAFGFLFLLSSRDEECSRQFGACSSDLCLLQRFYMIGRDKSRSFWRVLKIDREGASDLNVVEDSATYTENECWELRKRIHEGNLKTGGLKFVTTCYGIIGMSGRGLSHFIDFGGAIRKLSGFTFSLQVSSSSWDPTTCCS